jgi:hypothetical protein
VVVVWVVAVVVVVVVCLGLFEFVCVGGGGLGHVQTGGVLCCVCLDCRCHLTTNVKTTTTTNNNTYKPVSPFRSSPPTHTQHSRTPG